MEWSINEVYLYLPALTEHASNTAPKWANAIDGDSATSCDIEDGGTILQVENFGGSELTSLTPLNDSWTDFDLIVHVGTITGTNSFEVVFGQQADTCASGIARSATVSGDPGTCDLYLV